MSRRPFSMWKDHGTTIYHIQKNKLSSDLPPESPGVTVTRADRSTKVQSDMEAERRSLVPTAVITQPRNENQEVVPGYERRAVGVVFARFGQLQHGIAASREAGNGPASGGGPSRGACAVRRRMGREEGVTCAWQDAMTGPLAGSAHLRHFIDPSRIMGK